MAKSSSSKITNWTKKMDQYYNSVSKEKLVSDLSKSGFKVKDKK